MARHINGDRVILCVDQSASMATLVVYASIFSAVLASIPEIKIQLLCLGTVVLDLTPDLSDPVAMLFGVQLGGGTDINHALAAATLRVEVQSRTLVILISNLVEGGDHDQRLRGADALVHAGVNLVCLLALSDQGHPAFSPVTGAPMAQLGATVLACRPDQFPDLIAACPRRQSLADWAAENGTTPVAVTKPSATGTEALS